MTLTYDYDKSNHRTRQVENDGTVTTWTYDNIYQLINEHRSSGPSGTSFNITYTYDNAGNRLTKTDGGVLTTYTYDNANRLLLENAGGSLTTYTNDPAGNRTQKEDSGGIVYYDWDAAGRMKSAEPPAGEVTYTYNADHQRMGKTMPSGSATGFLYDYRNLLQETDGIGGDAETMFTSTTDDEYGDLLSEDGSAGELYHQYDAQWSTNALLDDGCGVQGQYKYQAFGLAQSAGASLTEGWTSLTVDQWSNLTEDGWAALPVMRGGALPGLGGGFAQKQYYLDPETELYVLGMSGGGGDNRPVPYDPATGRRLIEDPIRQAGGYDNLYPTPGNDPINKIDPSGRQDPSSVEELIERGIVMPPDQGPRVYESYRLLPAPENPSQERTSLFPPPPKELAEFFGFAKGVGEVILTVALATVIIGGIAMLSVPVAITAAGAVIIYGISQAATKRIAEGEKTVEIVGGSLADVTGAADLWAAATDQDIATGRKLNLSEAQRGEALGKAVGGALIIYGAVKAKPLASREGTSASVPAGRVGTYSTTIRWGIQNVEARPAGIGFWGRRVPQANPKANAYELKINPNDESFFVPHPEGGFVQFENVVGRTLQDAKWAQPPPGSSIYRPYDLPAFARNKIIEEARRQLEAASAHGMHVQWLVSDRDAFLQLSRLFRENGMSIRLNYLPE